MLHDTCIDENAIIHGCGRASADDILHLDVLPDEVIVRAATSHLHAWVFALGHSLSDHDLVEHLLASSIAKVTNEQYDRHDKKSNDKAGNEGQLVGLVLNREGVRRLHLSRDVPRHLELLEDVLDGSLVHHFNLLCLTVTKILLNRLFAHDLILHKSDFNSDLLAANLA